MSARGCVFLSFNRSRFLIIGETPLGIRAGLYQVSSGYLTISRYFFYGLVIIGLLGTATGVFAQSPTQQLLTLALSNVKVVATPLHQVDIIAVSGTVSVSGAWSGGAPPLCRGGGAGGGEHARAGG